MREKIRKHKYLVGGLIIFIVASIILAGVVIELHNMVEENSIRSEVVVVQDKYYDQKDYHHHYFVLTQDGNTYSFSDKSEQSIRMYNAIEKGKTYRFVLQDPNPLDDNQYIHIIQVHNVD